MIVQPLSLRLPRVECSTFQLATIIDSILPMDVAQQQRQQSMLLQLPNEILSIIIKKAWEIDRESRIAEDEWANAYNKLPHLYSNRSGLVLSLSCTCWRMRTLSLPTLSSEIVASFAYYPQDTAEVVAARRGEWNALKSNTSQNFFDCIRCVLFISELHSCEDPEAGVLEFFGWGGTIAANPAAA